MKPVVSAAVICAAFFLSAHRPASAMAEFCPAELSYKAVGSESATPQTAQLYGFHLSALTARTIDATLAFDTSAGWFTVQVPQTRLSPKVTHYIGELTFVERDYLSPKMYVRFPEAVLVNHAWTYSAATLNDGAGWQQKGTVICPPPSDLSPDQKRRTPKGRQTTMIDPKDDDRLSDPPDAASMLLAAQPSKALESAACAEPFRLASVLNQIAPNYPDSMLDRELGRTTVSVEIALTPEGRPRDVWLRVSSGYQAFDDAALNAAKLSTYQGARSYCQPVPGRYLFNVTFDPKG
jgi:TonB family protein